MHKVLDGSKTQTRRISKYKLKVGRAYAVRSGMLEPAQARITITRAWRQQLRDLTPEDVHKEGFSSFTEFRQAWIDIYGSWNPDQIVTAYEFRLLTSAKKDRPSPAATGPRHEPKKQA